jgi:tRNA(Ile)-lysidine synthase
MFKLATVCASSEETTPLSFVESSFDHPTSELLAVKRTPTVIDAITDTFDQYDVSNCRVCVALSGGLDSIVLLHAMCGLARSRKIELSAVHVNHGLSSRADKWSEFCIDQCRLLGIGLSVQSVFVDLGAGLGTEAAARAARYDAFSKCDVDFLALAHHADDQVETFLIQLLRGGGASGLSAMPVERGFVEHGPRLLRPLLSLHRTEIEEFATQQGLRWEEDDSNADLSIDRNFLRHSLLPLLEQRFPAYRSTLMRTTQNLADAAQLAEILGRQDLLLLHDSEKNPAGLNIEKLRCWPRSRALNAFRCLFRAEGFPLPHRAAIGEALRQVLEARWDARVRVDFGDVSLRRYREHVYLVKNIEVPPDWYTKWSGEHSVELPAGLGELRLEQVRGVGLSARALQGCQVGVGFRHGGERMAVAAGRPHRDLSKLFQDAGVAPWMRERTPMVFCGRTVVCVPGVGFAAEFQANADEASFDVEWLYA